MQSPCQRMIGVYNHLLSKVFRLHYHSQKLIGWLGISIFQKIRYDNPIVCLKHFRDPIQIYRLHVEKMMIWKDKMDQNGTMKVPCWTECSWKSPLVPISTNFRGKTWDTYLYFQGYEAYLLQIVSPCQPTTSKPRGWKGWQNLVNEREIGDQWLDEADGRRRGSP